MDPFRRNLMRSNFFIAITFGNGPGGIVTITDPTVLEIEGI